MSSRIIPPLIRARLDGRRLAVPGVIGVIEAPDVRYALIGADAGWPIFQPMDEWRDEVVLVEKRALSLEDRAVLERKLPDAELAEALAFNADMESYELPPPHSEEELRSLKLASAARLLVVSETERWALQGRGVPIYRVGYHRGPSVLSVEVVEGQESTPTWVSAFDVSRIRSPDRLPAHLNSRQFHALFNARWIDRALRMLTHGIITEGAVQLARYCARGSPGFTLLKDGAAEAAITAAVKLSAFAEPLDLPLHGRARWVRLPSFTLPVDYPAPNGKPGAMSFHTQLEVLPEDCWLLLDR
jgi:hypothetical protein